MATEEPQQIQNSLISDQVYIVLVIIIYKLTHATPSTSLLNHPQLLLFVMLTIQD